MELKALCKNIRRYIRAIDDIEEPIYETGHKNLADKELQTTNTYEKNKKQSWEDAGDYAKGDYDDYGADTA